ncbi:MAG: ribonuclease P protein component [Lachnospiraceae bacterium]|nr:ribonuclease P protein component [Lachnospiraceae bacterium]
MRNIDSLRTAAEFDAVYQKHCSLSDPYLVVYQAEGTGKLGIVCSKKVGNSVVRHRFARLVREAYRLNKEHIRKDRDIIVLARKGAKGQGYTVIESSLIKLLKRHSVYVMKN